MLSAPKKILGMIVSQIGQQICLRTYHWGELSDIIQGLRWASFSCMFVFSSMGMSYTTQQGTQMTTRGYVYPSTHEGRTCKLQSTYKIHQAEHGRITIWRKGITEAMLESGPQC